MKQQGVTKGHLWAVFGSWPEGCGESKKPIKSWSHLRFSIIGPLLARPPKRGELQKELEALASRRYPHPTRSDSWITFGVSTIERWYYRALESHDPVSSLGRKVRTDAGARRALTQELASLLHDQYRQFTHWSYQLHADNLAAYIQKHPELGEMPSYSTIRREMVKRGHLRRSACSMTAPVFAVTFSGILQKRPRTSSTG